MPIEQRRLEDVGARPELCDSGSAMGLGRAEIVTGLVANRSRRFRSTCLAFVASTRSALARIEQAPALQPPERQIEVLLDRDAVTTGAATGGNPFEFYDLGHGCCSYTFFEQCPHRMACARCDLYTPKDSGQAQLLEARDNLQRMLASIPLTDDERAAVEDGQAALNALLARLTDIPTPAGTTPRQIGGQPAVTLLPIADVRHGKSRQP